MSCNHEKIIKQKVSSAYDKSSIKGDKTGVITETKYICSGCGKEMPKPLYIVTAEEVDDNMKDCIVKTIEEFGKPVTYVTIRMKNGFTLRESTTCVDPENYSEKIGEGICKTRIRDKIWFLLGYMLQEKMFKNGEF